MFLSANHVAGSFLSAFFRQGNQDVPRNEESYSCSHSLLVEVAPSPKFSASNAKPKTLSFFLFLIIFRYMECNKALFFQKVLF